MAGKQLFDYVRQIVPFSQGLLVSTLPRGGMHIVQPGKVADSLMKAYDRSLQAEDRLAWQAVMRNQALRIDELWSEADFQSSPYLHGMLQPNGMRYAFAVPLAAPVLDSYPGALLLFRTANDGNFSDAEVARLQNLGTQVDEFINKNRSARNSEVQAGHDPWSQLAPMRHFIFTKDGKSVFPRRDSGLDARVLEQLQQHTRQALEHLKRGQAYTDRLLLPDANGELWIFHVEVYKEFPAIGANSYVMFTLQPESYEWTAVRPSDIAADAEMVRLLPTLKFMEQEFSANPTLDDIAKKAHLSPFHFHRRFTNLFGQTPKHFLLSCQIHKAKRLLGSHERELAQIATDCGFAHQSHFTSRFRQATGLTPTRWRRLADEIVRNNGRR